MERGGSREAAPPPPAHGRRQETPTLPAVPPPGRPRNWARDSERRRVWTEVAGRCFSTRLPEPAFIMRDRNCVFICLNTVRPDGEGPVPPPRLCGALACKGVARRPRDSEEAGPRAASVRPAHGRHPLHVLLSKFSVYGGRKDASLPLGGCGKGAGPPLTAGKGTVDREPRAGSLGEGT